MRRHTTLLLIAVLFLTAAAALAQTDRGAIRGTVLDASGAGVPNATVQALNSATGIAVSTTSGADGGFSFSLAPGVYTITVESAGFKKALARDITVHIGGTARADVTLQVGDVTENIEVIGTAI